MVPFLVEHSLSIIGAIFSVMVLSLKPKGVVSSAEEPYTTETYTTDMTDKLELLNDEHKFLYMILMLLAIAMSCYSWLVIFALYKEYTILQIVMLQRVTAPAAIAMRRNVALIESGFNPTYDSTYSRNKIGIQ